MPEESPRNVVVTGGGTGIGRGHSGRLHRPGLRYDDHRTPRRPLEEAAASLGAAWVAFDASDPAAVSAALDQLPQAVAVLVNNAGGNTDFDRGGPGRERPGLRWRPPGRPTSMPTCCRPS